MAMVCPRCCQPVAEAKLASFRGISVSVIAGVIEYEDRRPLTPLPMHALRMFYVVVAGGDDGASLVHLCGFANSRNSAYQRQRAHVYMNKVRGWLGENGLPLTVVYDRVGKRWLLVAR